MKTTFPNEIPLKQWVSEEADRSRVQPHVIRDRLSDGRYPRLPLRRVNKRVIFVTQAKGAR